MKLITDKNEFCNKNNKIGIYNQLVGGCVLTDIDMFEEDCETFRMYDDSEYSMWGGKIGFMKYLEGVLKQEDKYFKKNPRKINGINPRYQGFCDDMVLYEVVRYVLTNSPILVSGLEVVDDIESKITTGLMDVEPISKVCH
jgi:hypothetical protein